MKNIKEIGTRNIIIKQETMPVGASIARPHSKEHAITDVDAILINRKPQRNCLKHNQAGITLIALIITIIVLLILASITINLTLGERGIFNTAKKAVENYKDAEERELANLDNFEQEAYNTIYGIGNSSTKNDIVMPKVEVGEKAKDASTIDGKKGTYQNPTIPKEYYPVNTEEAKWDVEGGAQYDNGLVITDALDASGNTNGNEWVWVPLTKSELEGMNKTPPGVVSYDTSNYGNAGFASANDMKETMGSEYSDMLQSIEKYGGFYIGRYELTANGEKAGVTLTNTTWYNLYAKCKTLAKTDSSTISRMICDCQWDVTCNWLAKNPKYNVTTDSSSWGNYSNTAVKVSDGTTTIKTNGIDQRLDTGITTFTMAKNIYDIAGNCWEWTQKADSSVLRACRGGSYDRIGFNRPASYRGNSDPTDSSYGNVRFSCHINIESIMKRCKLYNRNCLR